MNADCDIYVYKVVADVGGAPCVWRGMLSLAICKPMIRKCAGEGALIFGFGGKEYGERLIYIAEVTEKPECGDYYRKPQYAKRPDCIYRSIHGKAERRPNARFHTESDERKKDVGMRFEEAHVLLSQNFRYFGKAGTDSYKQDFPAIARLIKGLKRGHRLNHSKELRRQLMDLKKQAWRKYRRMMIGSPTEANQSRLCNR
jgi:hypothetical protein